MVIIVKTEERLLTLFDLRKEAIPRDYIVLVLVIEDHLRVDEVLNNLLATTILQKLWPCRADSSTLLIVMDERVVMQVKGRSHVDVESGHEGKDDEDESRIHAVCHNGAFAETEVPYLLAEVIWQTEASLFTHALQASTAPMHRILGQEKDDWCNNES